MKVIQPQDNPDSWGNKINFVDENNVLVGFDMSQDCCESFGWFIDKEVATDETDIYDKKIIEEDLDDYYFDTNFFTTYRHSRCDEGGIAIFRLVKYKVIDGKQVSDSLYLHLYNSHNGYYSHGFNMNVEGKDVWGGYL